MAKISIPNRNGLLGCNPWAIRPAAAEGAGGGHVLRCLAIAAALPTPPVFFVEEPERWRHLLGANGFRMESEAKDDGLNNVHAAVRAGLVSGVIVDGYNFSMSELRAIANLTFLVEVKDDVSLNAGHAVIAPGLVACQRDYPGVKGVFGAEYALLREEFSAERVLALDETSAPGGDRVLVSMGLQDSVNATELALEAIGLVACDLDVKVVLGRTAPHLARVRERLREFPNSSIEVDSENMVRLYRSSDLCIGAGGGGLLERLCVGLPSIVLTLASNQLSNVEFAASRGMIIHAGDARKMKPDELAGVFNCLKRDGHRREAMRRVGMASIDGLGAMRAAREMEAFRRAHFGGRRC